MSKNILTNYDLFEKWLLNEMSISDDRIKNQESILKNIQDHKKCSIHLSNLIISLKQKLIELDEIKFERFEKTETKIYTKVKYPMRIKNIISLILDILEESEYHEKLNIKYKEIIYPDGNETEFEPDIDIETNNFNRIHIPEGLPLILRGIGLGKNIYKSLIIKLGWLSTIKSDQTIDAVFVWDSLRKEKDIYTFIKDYQVLCISEKLEYDKIVKILKEFYKKYNNYILDDDFCSKYKILNLDFLK